MFPHEGHHEDERQPARGNRLRTAVILIFALLLFPIVLLAFGLKLYELAHTFREESEGVFAITPLVNYLLASLGFLCMLIWATINGMFNDMELPKYVMLEREQALDRQRSGVSHDDRP